MWFFRKRIVVVSEKPPAAVRPLGRDLGPNQLAWCAKELGAFGLYKEQADRARGTPSKAGLSLAAEGERDQ